MKNLVLLLLAVLAACGSGSNASNASGAQPAAAPVYPPGIREFKSTAAASEAGLYASRSIRNCCFIKQRAVLTLEKPAGAQVATLYFFVPNVPPYKTGQYVTVSVGGRSATASSKAGRQVVISLALPPRFVPETEVPIVIVATKSVIPQKLGINQDTRDVSVLLKKVDYL
jgi:hypothetical protein